jgi:hypothetical protein
MTQALAERAVEVTSNISHLLEGAEETPQLLDNIFQLEQYDFLLPSKFHTWRQGPRTLRDIYVFVQSETQRNLILRVLLAKDLRVRYFSLDRQLRGFFQLFEVLHQHIRSFPSLIWQSVFQQTVKKPLVLCAGSLSTTTEEDHLGVVRFNPLCSTTCIQASQQDGPLAEIGPTNNSSAIHARYSNFIEIYSVPLTLHSGSIFHHAKNTVVRDGAFYAAHNLVVKQVQSEKSP